MACFVCFVRFVLWAYSLCVLVWLWVFCFVVALVGWVVLFICWMCLIVLFCFNSVDCLRWCCYSFNCYVGLLLFCFDVR